MRSFKVEEYRSFQQVTQELQAVPYEKFVRDFIVSAPGKFNQPVKIFIDELSLVPLIEAIGMRLKYCLDHSLERQPGQLFEGDRILDALQLLKILSSLMSSLERNGEAVRVENLELVEQAHVKLAAIAEEVLQSWEDAGL